jgi:hypothetical protein
VREEWYVQAGRNGKVKEKGEYKESERRGQTEKR